MSEDKTQRWHSFLSDSLRSHVPVAKASTTKSSDITGLDFKFSNTPEYDECSKESEDILSTRELFQGFKVEVQRHIAENFIVGHTINIGSSYDPKKPKRLYGFITQLAFPTAFVFGRISSLKDHSARCVMIIDKENELSIGADSQPTQGGEARSFNVEASHKSKENVANLKFVFEDHPQGSGVYFELGYVKRLMHLLALGCNITYIPSNAAVVMGGCIRMEKSMLSDPVLYRELVDRKHRFNLRLKNVKKVRPLIPEEQEQINEVLFEPKCFATANFQAGNLELTYTNQLSKKFGLSTSLTFAQPPPFQQQSGYTAVWKTGFKFNTNHVSAKGVITDFTLLESTLEQKLHELISISLSSQADISKDVYNFGVGLDISL